MTNAGIETRNMKEFEELLPDCRQKECLRKIVPGIKAEDYDVKCLSFSNLVAFLISKSINELVGTTIFDYGIIFNSSKGYRLADPILSIYDNILSNENVKNGIKFLNEDVIANLSNSIIDRSKLALITSELIAISLEYTCKVIEFWYNNYWYTDGKSISQFASHGGFDEWLNVLSGISIHRYDFLISDINIRNESFAKWFNALTINFSIGGVLHNALFSEISNNTTTPMQNQQVTIQMPVMNTDLNTNKSKIDLVGWQDLQPGILPTDANDQQPQQQMGAPFSSGATDYEHLNQQEKTIVDGLVQNMQHMEEMKNNPHAFEDEINAAKEALRQATEGIFNQQQPVAPQINIQPTTSSDDHTCNCGHEHCSCGGQH